MAEVDLLGAKIRSLRRREQLTQVDLAAKLGISASYLNLIEAGKRPLTAPLLLKLADLFQVELQSFASPEDARLVADLMEAFNDPLFQRQGLTSADVRELAVGHPSVAKAVVAMSRAWHEARESAETLATQLTDGEGLVQLDHVRLPSEEVNDFIQRHHNYFPELEDAAERLWRDAPLDPEDRFHSLARYLDRTEGIRVEVVHASQDPSAVRRYDQRTKRLTLSDQLPPHTRNFQLAHQVGLITQSNLFDAKLKGESFATDASRKLSRVVLANYFAAAVLLPYQPFLEAARTDRYDIELLVHRFRSSFEQICHRLTTLRRPGAEGVPFHFLRIDIAGNISKRFSASGIRFARFSGACPRWNVHAAFLTPGMIRVQVSRMLDGTVYFDLARTVRRDSGGYHALHTMQAVGLGCRAEHAKELVYSDGIDLENIDAATPVGISCRLCERLDCEQRVFPPLSHALEIDENVRGISFYAPASGKE